VGGGFEHLKKERRGITLGGGGSHLHKLSEGGVTERLGKKGRKGGEISFSFL